MDGLKVIQQYKGGGRFYSYPDGRWISGSDDNYATQTENQSESAGTGADPVVEWENHGFYFKKGQKITDIHMRGRTNDVTNSPEYELAFYFVHPNPITRYETGWDNDAEMYKEQLYRGLWRSTVEPDALGQVPFTHPINDMHRRIYELNYVAPEDGWLTIFMRPLRLAASAGNDYFYSAYNIYYETDVIGTIPFVHGQGQIA